MFSLWGGGGGEGESVNSGWLPIPVLRSVPAYFVLVDAEGEVKDYVKLNNFMKRQNSRIKQEAEGKVRCSAWQSNYVWGEASGVGRCVHVCVYMCVHFSCCCGSVC